MRSWAKMANRFTCRQVTRTRSCNPCGCSRGDGLSARRRGRRRFLGTAPMTAHQIETNLMESRAKTNLQNWGRNQPKGPWDSQWKVAPIISSEKTCHQVRVQWWVHGASLCIRDQSGGDMWAGELQGGKRWHQMEGGHGGKDEKGGCSSLTQLKWWRYASQRATRRWHKTPNGGWPWRKRWEGTLRIFILDAIDVRTAIIKGQKVESDIDLWNKQIGHVNFQQLQELQAKQFVFGLPKFSGQKSQVCEACQVGKQNWLPFPNERNHSQNKLDLIHSDVSRLTQNMNIGGSRTSSPSSTTIANTHGSTLLRGKAKSSTASGIFKA